MDEPLLLVEPCVACRRHIRRSADRCPFCDAPHEAKPIMYRALPRTRLALAGGAMLLAAACGSPEGETGDDGDGSGGGEIVDGSGGGDGSGDGEVADGSGGGDANGGEGSCGEVEQSCAGVCGDHHQPQCDENGENCVAPPYGTPPIDAEIV